MWKQKDSLKVARFRYEKLIFINKPGKARASVYLRYCLDTRARDNVWGIKKIKKQQHWYHFISKRRSEDPMLNFTTRDATP